MTSLLQTLLGIGAQELTVGQMALRAVLTVVVALAIVRLGHKRLFGKGTAYDLVVAVMFGSVMSRAITNASGLFAVWLAGLVLVLVHRVLAALAFRFHWLGPVVKGHPVQLVEDGQVDDAAMRHSHVSRLDLEQAVRQTGSVPDLSGVQLAYLERDGDISVVLRHAEPRILEVAVENGVQTVRIAIE